MFNVLVLGRLRTETATFLCVARSIPQLSTDKSMDADDAFGGMTLGEGGAEDYGNSTVSVARNIVNSQPLDDTPFVAPYVPCTDHIAREALSFAAIVHGKDVLVDLGCGDGRILRIAASSKDAAPRLCVGVELDPYLAQHARESIAPFATVAARDSGLAEPASHGVTGEDKFHPQCVILERDFLTMDLAHPANDPQASGFTANPTVMVLYLLSQGLKKLSPQLADFLRADPAVNRIVSIVYEIPDWTPREVREVPGGDGMGGHGSGATRTLRLYTSDSIPK